MTDFTDAPGTAGGSHAALLGCNYPRGTHGDPMTILIWAMIAVVALLCARVCRRLETLAKQIKITVAGRRRRPHQQLGKLISWPTAEVTR